jgi:hypothetical protein
MSFLMLTVYHGVFRGPIDLADAVTHATGGETPADAIEAAAVVLRGAPFVWRAS